jgi:CrcB protein
LHQRLAVTGAGFIAIGVGAALGAWARWALAVLFNASFPMLPLGTLAANLIGGFGIGLAIEIFTRHAGLSEEMRLFVITGFLGAMTTFSTFSAEVVGLLARAHYGWALILASAHLAGSLIATIAGIVLIRWMSV